MGEPASDLEDQEPSSGGPETPPHGGPGTPSSGGPPGPPPGGPPQPGGLPPPPPRGPAPSAENFKRKKKKLNKKKKQKINEFKKIAHNYIGSNGNPLEQRIKNNHVNLSKHQKQYEIRIEMMKDILGNNNKKKLNNIF